MHIGAGNSTPTQNRRTDVRHRMTEAVITYPHAAVAAGQG